MTYPFRLRDLEEGAEWWDWRIDWGYELPHFTSIPAPTGPEILIVDVETNHVNPQRADILEIALARVELATGRIEIILDTLVCPDSGEEYWLGCWFMQHSGLDPAEIRRAPKFAAVKEAVQGHLARLPVTAYLSFDLQVLHRQGVTAPSRWPCLMLTCKDILKLPGYYGDYKYPKMSEAYGFFFPDEIFDDKHRAGHDVIHEAKLACALYQRGFLRG